MEKERKDLEENLILIGGKYAMFINASNMVYQLITFIDPTSTRHLIVNTVYTMNTIISCGLCWAGYRHNKIGCIFPGYALCAVRNVIRMIDIEDTVPHISTVQWFNLMTMQDRSALVFATIFFMYFRSVQGKYYYLVAYMTLWYVC